MLRPMKRPPKFDAQRYRQRNVVERATTRSISSILCPYPSGKGRFLKRPGYRRTIGQAISQSPTRQGSPGIGDFIFSFFETVCSVVALVGILRTRLISTWQGVSLRRWKTTFLSWSEIKVVRVRRLRNKGRSVRFVLGNRSQSPIFDLRGRRAGSGDAGAVVHGITPRWCGFAVLGAQQDARG